jgi:desulfoferrodoxin (superoxide reductase-like protein)
MRKDIKISIAMLLAFYSILFVFSSGSLAHSPERIETSIRGTLLNIKVYHNVGNTKMHYIQYINVYINGRWVTKQRFFSQQHDKYQEAVFNLPDLKTKDVVLIIAHCSRQGKIDKSIIVSN